MLQFHISFPITRAQTYHSNLKHKSNTASSRYVIITLPPAVVIIDTHYPCPPMFNLIRYRLQSPDTRLKCSCLYMIR